MLNCNKLVSALDANKNINNYVTNGLQINCKKDNDSKTNLDTIIKNIDTNFENNYYFSLNFTGKNYIDKKIVVDPNIYANTFDNTNNNSNLNKNKKILKKNIEIIKKTVIIDAEINTISDILKVIDTYSLDANIEYNINLALLHNIKEPLIELNNMIGMKNLKNNIVDQILYFCQEFHKNKNLSQDFMHTVIYGHPGTGKTEIAKILGKIYSNIGILSKGTFKKVTRSDLIAGYLGQTALKTREVINAAIGGVLFIDEAYALGNAEKKDSFSKECIDTLCEALSDNKDNLMVIIAGYENELKECFFNYNQGLESRFTWRFKTDEYTGEDLYNIFIKKVNDIGWDICPTTKITPEWFNKHKEYFKFYGRDIETILAKTKIAHSKRVFCKPESEKKKITITDLEKGFEIFINNNNMKNKKDEELLKKQIYYSLYC